ncbi:hypothetical protein [Actinomadura rubrobrunea]|nr:hypothetical protein [Actinomadura rubrobrunea]
MIMGTPAADVWIVTHDGRDLVRADAIVLIRLDDTGRLTAQLRDEARVTVALLEGSASGRPPADFHRQLIRMVSELADSSGAQLVRAQRDQHGWHWVSETL